MAIGHQSFYQTQLTSSISDTDLVIPVDNPPIPSEGFLVIEGTVEAKREIIYYTSKDGTSVTCPSGAGNGRGYDGTTAVSHLQGAAVVMAPVGAMFDQLGDITVNSITIGGTPSAEGWSPLGATPDTITANGNKSYDLVFNGTDLTDTITEGMRVRSARTVAAPVQCTSLNGTTQYYSKTSPNKMTFTDDFVVSAWVKLTSYATCTIVSRYNNTSGWSLRLLSTGVLRLVGYNGGSSNFRLVDSYQSLPLNKWVHIAVQLDMSAFTATTTTSYVMIDGVDVPALVLQGGTSPTALIQAGNLEIGSENGGTAPFPGKIAQVAIYNAKVTQATILASMNQGLSGSETNLASAYSFSNSITDLNTTTPNDLTANGSAVATNADSPFGNSGVSTTLDYGIVMKKAFSTNTTLTVQVPEGCTIPTSGGVSSMDYSIQAVPYGFVRDKGKWRVQNIYITRGSQSSPATNTAYNFAGRQMTIPIGKWIAGYDSAIYVLCTGAALNDGRIDFNTTSATYTATSPFAQSVVYINNLTEVGGNVSKRSELSLSTATIYYLNYRFATNGTGVMIADLADFSPLKIVADNAYL